MFTGFDKAIVAAVMSLVTLLSGFGVDLPSWITTEWLTALMGVATPVLVYFWPNKA